jgi:hypothetical protein
MDCLGASYIEQLVDFSIKKKHALTNEAVKWFIKPIKISKFRI